MRACPLRQLAPRASEKGADPFLAKPFTPTRLATTIDECLGRRQTPDDPVRTDSVEPRAATKSGSLGGLLRPLKQILEATGLITTDYSRLELKEIVGLATQAHQAASSVHQEIETWLPVAETGR